jgi:hypothetical protein
MSRYNQDEDEGEMYIRRKLKELYSSDQPRHECDGRIDDGRFQWTDSIFNFQLAATTKYEIEELWEENCAFIEASKGGKRPKEAARIGLFFGAPGIGKTRTLLELKNIIPCGGNYAYVSFNGGTTFFANVEEHANFDQMIAVRILYGSFESRKPGADFHQWLRHFDFKRRFSSKDCLSIIRSDEEGPFCLAIDSLTKIGPWAQYACDQITALVLTSPIIAFLGGNLQGNWEDALRNRNIPGSFLSLTPFNNTQINNILDQLQQPYAQYFIGWRANPDLRDILLRIGGVPRLLDQFVIECEKKFRNQSPPWDWKQMDALLEQIDPHSGLSSDYHNRLVKDVILRREVVRRGYVIKNGMTYDRLQSLGHIQLLRGHLRDTAFIFVPLLRFRQWVTQLTLGAGSRPFRILADLMRRKVEWGYWIDFEKVTAQYFQLLIHIWSEEAKEDPPKSVTWEEFFSTSIPGWLNEDIKFIEESPEFITSMAQFPKCGSKIRESQHHKEYNFDNGFVFINAPSAPFADVFFTCRHGEDEAKCLVAIQCKCKLYQKTKMDKTAVNVEVKKNKDAMKSYQGAFGDCSSMYTVILVSTPYSNCEEAEDDDEDNEDDDNNNQKESSESMEVDESTPPHRSIRPDEFKTHIVLGHEQLQKFFPQPLRDYTFRVMSSGRLNINCAPLGDVKKLLKLTKDQAKKFGKERMVRGGFKSKDDLPFEVNPDQLELLEF